MRRLGIEPLERPIRGGTDGDDSDQPDAGEDGGNTEGFAQLRDRHRPAHRADDDRLFAKRGCERAGRSDMRRGGASPVESARCMPAALPRPMTVA